VAQDFCRSEPFAMRICRIQVKKFFSLAPYIFFRLAICPQNFRNRQNIRNKSEMTKAIIEQHYCICEREKENQEKPFKLRA